MSNQPFLDSLATELTKLKDAGLYKTERTITSAQKAVISLSDGSEVINMCANNYLGLADHPSLVKVAQEALHTHGFGMSSVRFICGTQAIHKELEKELSSFLGKEDTILYSSCFDANGGLFETILNEEDAVISDALNHASIIDGIRLCKAQRHRYANNDMAELEQKLKDTQNCRYRLIATDGVFSMDGTIANLPAICDLADKYNALVMVDDSHAVGFLGHQGKGTPEFHQVVDRIDILTGTLGKAMGGASGGYTSGRKEIIEWLRQRSRPYLFSNTLAPVITATSIQVVKLLETSQVLRSKLLQSTAYFRAEITKHGFKIVPGIHPIVPVMLGDAKLAKEMADALLKKNIYVIGFSYPVVPMNAARIRVQISAAHSQEHIDHAINSFVEVGKSLGVI